MEIVVVVEPVYSIVVPVNGVVVSTVVAVMNIVHCTLKRKGCHR